MNTIWNSDGTDGPVLITTPPPFAETMNELVAKLDAIETREHAKNYTTLADKVHWSAKGKKFAYIDIGGSGAWLVEKTTGEIFNIKGYGTPDYNKKKKANIGNIYTVDPEQMHRRRWNYLK